MQSPDRIQSTATAFSLLDAIAEANGASVAELDGDLEISRTTIYKHLRALEDVDAVENDGGIFGIGPKFSEYVRARNSGITGPVQEAQGIDDLAVSLDAPVNLWIRGDDTCKCVYSSLPNKGRENPRHHEENHPLVDACPGKTILAYLPTSDREAVLADYEKEIDATQLTEQTQQIRDRKVLIESLEPDAGWLSISTPLFGKSGYPRGALEVVIPSERGQGIDIEVNIMGLLLDTASGFDIESM